MSGPPAAVSRLVIIGGGIAAQSLAEQVRSRSADIAITMLSAETRAPYDRVQLSKLLADGGDAERLRLRPATWYEDARVELRLGVAVAAIDRAAGQVVSADGERIAYDRLAICTGSTALVPPIPGIDKAGSFVFRTPEDCDAILAAATPGRHAAVIGGGLLGLEAARGLVARGVAVTVVHLADSLMERQIDTGAAEILAARMTELDVAVLLGRSTAAIVGSGRVAGLALADGARLDCDLVVTCIGIRANVALAAAAGLACERGVVVDDAMRTDDPDIWAVGECAQHRGIVYGLVSPIHDQAKVAAAAIVTGDPPAPYGGSVPSATLKVMGVAQVCAGDPLRGDGVVVCDIDNGVYRKLAMRDGVAVGAILMGDTRGAQALLSMVTGAERVVDPLAALARAAEATVAELPDEAQICACNGVTKGEICAAIGARADGDPRGVRHHPGGHRLWQLPAARDRAAPARDGGDRRGADLPLRLPPADPRDGGRAGARRGAALGERGDERLRRRPRLRGVQARGRLHGRDDQPEPPRGGRHARFINDRVHANIQNDGTFSVVPRIRGGVTTPAELRRIADVAERHDVRMVKITGGQRIDLLGVAKERLPAIWRELDMPSGFAYSKAVRTVKTCVGSEFCRFGIGDSISLGIEMEATMEGLRTPHKVKMGVSGCPRNCAESSVKDIGIIAVEGGWQVLIGGAAGSRVRAGDILDTVATPAAALRLAITFLEYYRETADYLERTYDYVERLGLDAIKAVVLDEESGVPAELRERLALARAAVSDPWSDVVDGAQATDFTDLGTDPEPAFIGPPPDALAIDHLDPGDLT